MINYIIMFMIVFVSVLAAKIVYDILSVVFLRKYISKKWRKFVKDNPEVVADMNKLANKIEREFDSYISEEEYEN